MSRDAEIAVESATAEGQAPGVVRCDACPVLCRIREGQVGACDRYANHGGTLVRLDPLRVLAKGGAQVSARLAVLGVDTPLADHVAPPQLTERQREIAWLVARGCTNAEIARMVGCSARTVKQQLSHLLARFDVSNRTELATVAASWSTTTGASPVRPIYVR